MKSKIKFSLIFIISIVILSIWAFITSINITNQFNKKFNETNTQKEEATIEEIVITETKEGKKYWEVYAKSGKYDNLSNTVKLNNVIGNFYKENQIVMSFKAPKGEYHNKKREVKLSNGAKIKAKDDTLIEADELVWKGAIDEVHAKGNVKIIKSNEFITYSDESIFSTDFKKFEISGNSKTQVYQTK